MGTGRSKQHLPMIVWNEQFVTGSDTIDQQHRTLIHNFNHLECLLTDTNPTRADCEFLIHMLDFLEGYVETHFRYEEDCMERHRCPVHAKNKQAHGQFMILFREFRSRSHAEGFRPEVIRSLYQTLGEWIQHHFLQVDTRLRPCIAAAADPVPVAD